MTIEHEEETHIVLCECPYCDGDGYALEAVGETCVGTQNLVAYRKVPCKECAGTGWF